MTRADDLPKANSLVTVQIVPAALQILLYLGGNNDIDQTLMKRIVLGMLEVVAHWQ